VCWDSSAAFDTEAVITDLGVGEALISVLDIKGVPGIVGRTVVRPPASRLGPALPAERAAIIAASVLKDKYTDTIDRESAYELLEEKSVTREKEIEKSEAKEAKDAEEAAAKKEAAEKAKEKSKKKTAAKKKTSSGRRRKSASGMIAHEAKLMARQLVRSQGRRILRGVLGGLLRR